jgi:hypothetical protein
MQKGSKLQLGFGPPPDVPATARLIGRRKYDLIVAFEGLACVAVVVLHLQHRDLKSGAVGVVTASGRPAPGVKVMAFDTTAEAWDKG